MTYQTELERIVGAKASMRQSIINKGVEVPEDTPIEDYPTYIAQITGGGALPDAPDLSQPLSAEQLSDLQKIVAAGKASDYYDLGDTIKVSYGEYTMPFEIVGFEDVEIEGGETVPAINLLAKYTSEVNSTWGASSTTKYSASILRTNITSTYQNKLDTDFIGCLANTKTQTYSRDGSTDVVYDKLFAPSMAQLGVTDSDYYKAVDGPAFTAYQGAANAKRVRRSIDATGTADAYWTRSLCSSNTNRFSNVSTSGAPDYGYNNTNRRVVVACNFIGDTN